MSDASGKTPPDPFEAIKALWGNMGFAMPGMVAPTFDTGELDKRIADLKAVEGWLQMQEEGNPVCPLSGTYVPWHMASRLHMQYSGH